MASNGSAQVNSSSYPLAIPPCAFIPEQDLAAIYSLTALNLLSCVINAIHMAILPRIPSLKGTPYFHLLMHLSAADIYYSLTEIVKFALSLTSDFRSASLAAFVVYLTVNSVPYTVRYWLMAATSLERYLALCRPLTYEGSHFIKRLKAWLAVVWCANVAFQVCLSVSFSDTLCFVNVIAAVNDTGALYLALLVVSVVPSAVTAGLIGRVVVELVRMRSRSVTSQEQQRKRAFYYLMAITASFYVCLLVPVVSYTLYERRGSSRPTGLFYFNNHFFLTFYGIFNVFIYGWISRGYRQRVSSFFRRSNRIGAQQQA